MSNPPAAPYQPPLVPPPDLGQRISELSRVRSPRRPLDPWPGIGPKVPARDPDRLGHQHNPPPAGLLTYEATD